MTAAPAGRSGGSGCRPRTASAVPTRRTRSAMPAARASRTSPATNAGSRSRVPTNVQVHGRSASAARAATSTSCPLGGITAATHSSAPPVGVPRDRTASSTPGRATWTSPAARAYVATSQSRVQPLVVSTARRAGQCHPLGVPRSPAPPCPSGMWTSTTWRSRFAVPAPAGRGPRRPPGRRAARQRRRGSPRGTLQPGARAPRPAAASHRRPRHSWTVQRAVAQPPGEAAVVDVAPAGTTGVADAGRDDQVHGVHSARS